MKAKNNLRKKSNTHQDVLGLIKKQHDQLRRCISVLKDENAESSLKQNQLEKFINLLNMHTEAEEQTLYEVLKELQASELVTLEAIEEHAVAKNLIQELADADYRTSWNSYIEAKAKVLADIVDHHAKDEEDRIFKEAKKLLTRHELIFLGEEFEQKYEELKQGINVPLHTLQQDNLSAYVE